VAAYSGTPLARKLGLREGSRVALLGAPRGFEASLEPLPEGATLLRAARRRVDVVLCFCPRRRDLDRRLPRARALLDADGGLWVVWPKKASGVPTDLAFEVVQPAGLAAGLVDNKVCAVDDIWSGLHFVYRREDRPALRRLQASKGARAGTGGRSAG
jgi:hypothetical protein